MVLFWAAVVGTRVLKDSLCNEGEHSQRKRVNRVQNLEQNSCVSAVLGNLDPSFAKIWILFGKIWKIRGELGLRSGLKATDPRLAGYGCVVSLDFLAVGPLVQLIAACAPSQPSQQQAHLPTSCSSASALPTAAAAATCHAAWTNGSRGAASSPASGSREG